MEITREQLAAALARACVSIGIDKLSAREHDDYVEGHVRYPYAAADVIIEGIREVCPEPTPEPTPGPEPDYDEGPCEFIRDPELAAMAAIMAAVDALESCEPSTTSRSVFGVLAYIAHRYGFTLAGGEDGGAALTAARIRMEGEE